MAKLFLKLRSLMTANDMTQEQLAWRLDRGLSYVSDRFNGFQSWTTDDAYAMLDLFGVPDDQIHDYFPRLPSKKERRRKAG